MDTRQASRMARQVVNPPPLTPQVATIRLGKFIQAAGNHRQDQVGTLSLRQDSETPTGWQVNKV